MSEYCLRSSFARDCSARLSNSEICGVTSSAKSLCASFTSVSVINSKCYISVLSSVKGAYAVDGEEFLHAWEVGYSCVESCKTVSQLPRQSKQE